MTISGVGKMNIPNWVCLSSDVADGMVAGTQPGHTIYFTDTRTWKIVKDDLSLADYATPSGGAIGAGTEIIGIVAIDQTTDGTTNGVSMTNGAEAGGAGTPSADVMTVQGITAGFPLPVSSDDVGTAGTANAGVFTVQGIASAYPVSINRYATVITPSATASTNAYVLVPNALLDTLNSFLCTFTIFNSGANSLNWKVIAGNTSGLNEDIEAQAEATVAAGAYGTFSATPAVWRYYGVKIKSTVDDTPGEGTVTGITKA